MREAAAKRRIGTTVGKFTLLRILGSGGMATVFEARHRNGNRVALKLLRPALGIDADVRARFLREGYAANRVGHPGAVRIHDDHETSDGLAFLVMDLLEGVTLAELARAHAGTLPIARVLEIGHQLLDVLTSAHAAGVVHRDIKPENVFVCVDGQVKVLDFGVARVPSADGTATRTGRMLGTPAFMSPEQAFGRRAEVDAQSDLWSVGATLFAVIAGRNVHASSTAEETLILAATTAAPPLASVVPSVPPSVAAIVDRALSIEKKDRYPSAAEMQAAVADAYRELFASPLPARVDLSSLDVTSTVEALEPAPARAPRSRIPLVLVAMVSLAAAGTAVMRETRPSVLSSLAPGVVRPTYASLNRSPSASPPTPREIASAPIASVAIASAPVASPKPSPPRPSATASAVASVVTPPTTAAVCFTFDDEGRKWPTRCP